MASIRRYLFFVKPYWKTVLLTIIIGLIKFVIPLAIPLLVKYVIDHIVQGNMTAEEKIHQLFFVMAAMFVLFVVIRPPVEYYRQYFAQWTGNKILFDIRERLFCHLQKLSLQFYANRKAGEIISRVIHDVEQTKNFVITGLMNVWLDMATIVFALAIMFSMDIWLTVIAMVMFPFYGFSIKYFYGRLRKLTRIRSQALAEVQAHLHERVQGMNVIKSFALEDYEQGEFSKKNEHFLEKALDHTSWNAKTFAVVNTVTDVAPLLVIFLSAYFVILGELKLGTMVAFVMYMERLYNPLRRLVNSSTTLTQSIASMDRVFQLMDEKYDIQDKANAVEMKNIKGEISFENVSFRYDAKSENVIKNLSLHIKPGETVAFVGMSGGGKSTLISLIPRFYDVTEGSIKIDGIDVRDYKVRSLRKNIGIVLQDNILFSDTVKNNILMSNPYASDEEVIAAAKQANAHEFIMKLPNGYETQVGERGVKLSGGQKQRIAIARVFLKNPPLLIFDEATSSLDLESEHYIQEAMEALAKGRTTIIVAHRLATITHADRIIVIEHGKITEIGTHEQLMKKKGSYYQLFKIQQLD